MHRPDQYHDDGLSCLRYLGVTPPISTSESSEREKEVTASLMDELRRQNTMESEEESRTRSVTLSLCSLDHFVTQVLCSIRSFCPLSGFLP